MPDIVNPLSVSTHSSGKQRLILDLRHVNSFIFKPKFKCEDLNVAIQIFDKGYHLFKFDLKSGYYHIEIFPAQRSLGILDLDLSDIFSFASFHLDCLQPLSSLLKYLSRFLSHGEVEAFRSPFSLMTVLVGELILFPLRLIV